ncbi:MAG: response regulator [Anaerolineae bacterium]|nr:response regulator [Anaerolineae bacterium]
MKKRILIVDDEPNLAFLLAENLVDLGPNYEIEVCNSSADALALNEEKSFDLVITDLMMPGINGLALTKYLAEQKPEIKLILMTAYGNEEVALRARHLGISSYITKPFEMEDMLAAVQTALNGEPVSQVVS